MNAKSAKNEATPKTKKLHHDSYEKALKLAKEKLIDLPGLYMTTLEELNKTRQRKAQNGENESYLWLQDRPLEYLENLFLKKLAGENLFPIPRDPIFGLHEPRRFDRLTSPAGKTLSSPSPTTDVERLPWLFSPKDAPPPFRDNTLAIFSAIGPTNDCREIIRRIVADKIPLDNIEIISPPGPTYSSLMYAFSAKAGLPTTFAEGIPPAFTSPGKVFSGLVEWLEHDYLVSDLCSLIEAGSLKLPSGKRLGDQPRTDRLAVFVIEQAPFRLVVKRRLADPQEDSRIDDAA